MSLAFETRAVDAVAALLEDATLGVNAQLAALETELGLDADTLPRVVDVVRALVPADYRSPLVMVFEETARPELAGHRYDLAEVQITVGIAYNSDANIEAAEILMRRYMTALRMSLHASPSCLGAVSQARWSDTGRTLELTYDSATRHGRTVGVVVRVHDP